MTVSEGYVILAETSKAADFRPGPGRRVSQAVVQNTPVSKSLMRGTPLRTMDVQQQLIPELLRRNSACP